MRDCYVIDGGEPLAGHIAVSGAKNSALKVLAASLLASGRTVLDRVPRIADVDVMCDVLRQLGAGVEWTGDRQVTVDVPERLGVEAPYELVSRMRASTAVLGPLVAREGRARVALPGGCNLGPRRIDLHLRGLEQLGATIGVSGGYLEASASRLRGAVVPLDYPSHGATENLLMAGVLAEGVTVIENASREPEIVDLAQLLTSMSARIEGAGTSRIEIEGVDELRPGRLEVMADRLEAGTYLFAAAAVGGDVTVEALEPAHLEMVVEKLRECGMRVETGDTWIRLVSDGHPHACDVSTLPYPGFPTDLQPLAVTLLTLADGLSIVTENIFDGRFMFVDELARMGADVRIEGHYAVVRGVPALSGAPVRAPDIRAGAALVIAGLAAEGRTVVEDVQYIDRGYEDLAASMAVLGARIRRQPAGALAEFA